MSGLHDQLGKRALELLPSWERDFWKREVENIPGYCFYPDDHQAAQWDPTPERFEFLGKYCIMPNGRLIPHGPVDSDGKCAAFAGDTDPAPTEYAVRYYCRKIIDLLRKNDVVESARFAGTLAHLAQDACIPVHAMNNILINRLFPDENGRYFFYHRIVDNHPFDAGSISAEPRLLGRNEEELIFSFMEEMICKVERNIGLLVPFLAAVKNGDAREENRISQEINADAVRYTVDLWHALFCIAFDRFEEADLRKFAFRDLTDSRMVLSYDKKYDRQKYIDAGIPFYRTLFPEADPCRARLATDPYAYEPAFDMAYDGSGNLIPLELIIDGGRRKAERGLAAGAFGIATFRVPGTIFSELDVYAGVHPESASDREVVFGVWCDDAPQPLLASGRANRKSEALHFHLNLPGNCREISLLSAGGDKHTSAVWHSPRLKYRDPFADRERK